MINLSRAKMLCCKTSLTEQQLNELKEFLEECSKAYYNTDKLIIDDTTYDILYKDYLKLGGSEIMGAEPPKTSKNVNSEHTYNKLVGTTLKAQNPEEFDEWLENVYKNLNLNYKDELELYITFKFDGNSILIEYNKNGTVSKALTRGRNGKGVDLTSTFRKNKIDLTKLNYLKENDERFSFVGEKPFAIKYECLFTYTDLERLCNENNEEYKNPRSAISGKLGSDDSVKFNKYYTLEPLWMEVQDEEIERDVELLFFEKIYPECANIQNLYAINGCQETLKEDLRFVYKDIIEQRPDLNFMIDGLVIDVADKNYRKRLGYIEGGENLKPKWCVALKFPYMSAMSKITKIEFTLGDSGKISPVAYFEPVKFNGADFTKQYLQGYKRFMELQLGIGSPVIIEYRNDTLTYITKVYTDEVYEPIPFTDKCPVCGSPIVLNENKTFAFCSNELCEGKKAGHINNYFKTMDIIGVDINTVSKLTEAEIWNDIPDIYNFDIQKASSIEGLGEKIIKNIVDEVNKKNYYDYEILGSMGIPSFKLSTAKELVQVIKLEDIMENINDEDYLIRKFMSAKGIAEKLAKNIYKGIIKNKETILFLMNRGYKILSDEINFDSTRYTFVVTGDLNRGTRGELKMKLEKRGHKLTGSVSKKTDYLVTNDTTTGTVKIKKAKELGKPIITEDELYQILNLE